MTAEQLAERIKNYYKRQKGVCESFYGGILHRTNNERGGAE